MLHYDSELGEMVEDVDDPVPFLTPEEDDGEFPPDEDETVVEELVTEEDEDEDEKDDEDDEEDDDEVDADADTAEDDADLQQD